MIICEHTDIMTYFNTKLGDRVHTIIPAFILNVSGHFFFGLIDIFKRDFKIKNYNLN